MTTATRARSIKFRPLSVGQRLVDADAVYVVTSVGGLYQSSEDDLWCQDYDFRPATAEERAGIETPAEKAARQEYEQSERRQKMQEFDALTGDLSETGLAPENAEPTGRVIEWSNGDGKQPCRNIECRLADGRIGWQVKDHDQPTMWRLPTDVAAALRAAYEAANE